MCDVTLFYRRMMQIPWSNKTNSLNVVKETKTHRHHIKQKGDNSNYIGPLWEEKYNDDDNDDDEGRRWRMRGRRRRRSRCKSTIRTVSDDKSFSYANICKSTKKLFEYNQVADDVPSVFVAGQQASFCLVVPCISPSLYHLWYNNN